MDKSSLLCKKTLSPYSIKQKTGIRLSNTPLILLQKLYLKQAFCIHSSRDEKNNIFLYFCNPKNELWGISSDG